MYDGCAEMLDSDPLASIFAIDKRYCFMNYSSGTVRVFDSKSKKITPFAKTISSQCVAKDNSGTVWISSWNGWLYGYNESGEIKHKILIDSIGGAKITLCCDHDGALWVGTMGAGLVHIPYPKSSNPTIERYKYKPGENSLSSNHDFRL